MNTKSIRVTVTGAAGQIGYALLFRIASGQMFGLDTQIHLNLLELEAALPALNGVRMELDDSAFPLLQSITTTSSLDIAFKDSDWAILVGSVPRKAGMERSDLLKINGKTFIEQGKSLAANAKKTCKVLVVGNPCNTNAFIIKETIKSLPAKNFFAMTMLDQNRASTQIAQKAGVPVTVVKNIAIWGNHSTTMYPDFYNATIAGNPLTQAIPDETWLKTVFLETVQKRGAAIIQARGLSSAGSAANAVVDTVRNLTTETPKGEWFSVAMASDGSYGIPQGLMFSFPVRTDGYHWEIVQGLKHNAFSEEKIKATLKELQEERNSIKELM